MAAVVDYVDGQRKKDKGYSLEADVEVSVEVPTSTAERVMWLGECLTYYTREYGRLDMVVSSLKVDATDTLIHTDTLWRGEGVTDHLLVAINTFRAKVES